MCNSRSIGICCHSIRIQSKFNTIYSISQTIFHFFKISQILYLRMKSSKDQYSSYLTGVKKKPFFNPDRRETKQLINHQRNNTSAAFNPLASHYDDATEHTQNTFKAGSIVEKVKEELNKTINAKRRLLERNFINFRFDEFKKGQQQVVQQLEEIEKKKMGSPQKGIENHPIKNGMWKSIEVYTPQHYAQFQNMMTARQNIQ